MADRAQVTSFEAVNSFRADLIVFLSRARAVLEEASDDVLRTRLWVQNDQRRLWEGETRVRYQKLEEARAELFSASWPCSGRNAPIARPKPKWRS